MTMYEADSSKQRQVWRFRVPVNDTPCTFNFPGHVIHVDASREYGVVEFWAEVEMGRDPVKHTYQVIGTG